MRWRDSSRTRGASLLDELTAVVVLSVGLLGLAGLQGRTLGMAAQTQARAMALTLADNELERLRGRANAPGNEAAGYKQIGNSSQTLTEIDGQRLRAPFRVDVAVARYRVVDDGSMRYRPVELGNNLPYDSATPEFKQVLVTVAWQAADGKASALSLQGIVSPGPF